MRAHGRQPARCGGPRTLPALLALLALHCGTGNDDGSLRIEFFSVDGEELSRSDRRVVEEIARAAVVEARRHLPGLPTPLVIRVQPERGAGGERGETGTASQPSVVMWSVDPHHPDGVQGVAKTWLRACMLHELHHLVRDAAVPRTSMLDHAVSEGMATAFERDVTDMVPPWGAYPPEAASWVDELRDMPTDSEHRKWLWQHPDGRRWIGAKAGAYLVDRATRTSGRSAADLVTTGTREVLRLAGSP